MALTLDSVRLRLTDRLAEESTVFWSEESRVQAINDAQRIVSAVTHGVPEKVLGDIGGATRVLAVQGRPVGEDAATGVVLGDDPQGARVGSARVGTSLVGLLGVFVKHAIVAVRRDVADALNPHWWGVSNLEPRWMIVDEAYKQVHFTPVPRTPVGVEVEVRVLPQEVTQDNDLLFNGVDFMDKYLQVVILYAAAILLLRERYEGDAERFYGLAMAELQRLGHASGDLPPLPVSNEAQA